MLSKPPSRFRGIGVCFLCLRLAATYVASTRRVIPIICTVLSYWLAFDQLTTHSIRGKVSSNTEKEKSKGY
jgi:hypothetical protein